MQLRESEAEALTRVARLEAEVDGLSVEVARAVEEVSRRDSVSTGKEEEMARLAAQLHREQQMKEQVTLP